MNLLLFTKKAKSDELTIVYQKSELEDTVMQTLWAELCPPFRFIC